jgi:aryl-alcohol dehydrogenase-like predicted oxidoreductase
MEQVDASLRRLGTDYIDLYQVHGVDPVTPLDETLRALEDTVRAGKVRYVGCSNMPAWQVMKALGISESNGWIRFESFQGHYAVVARDIEREIVPLLNDQRLALMVWSPLAGGLLTDKFYQPRGAGTKPEDARRSKVDFPPVNRERLPKVLEALHRVAAGRGVTMAQVALAWLLHQPVVTSVVVGAKRPEQLEENLAATDIRLSAADLELLDASSALPPEYPGWMIAQQAGERFTPTV